MNHFFLIIIFSIIAPSANLLLGQCTNFPPTTSSSDCGAFAPLTNNSNISFNQTFSVCGSSSTIENYANVSLNGGTIRVCGNATLSGNFNAGRIVVECGATLIFPQGLLLNSNVGIVNYGTVRVSGDLNFQNSNVFFYNESPSSKLFVSRDLKTAQNANQSNYIKNRGYISVTGHLFAIEGGHFCLSSNSSIECNEFTYMKNCGGPNNRFIMDNITTSAVIRYTQSASLNATVTNNDSLIFLQAPSSLVNFNGSCGSFGNATVIPDAPPIPIPNSQQCTHSNCFVLLPIELLHFNLFLQDNKQVKINWATTHDNDNKKFQLQRSQDGIEWQTVTTQLPLTENQNINNYEWIDREAPSGVVYYRLEHLDFDNSIYHSPIRAITIPLNKQKAFVIAPNPVSTTLSIQIDKEHITFIQIYDLQGQLLFYSNISETTSARIHINLSTYPSGTYLVKTNLGNKLFSKT